MDENLNITEDFNLIIPINGQQNWGNAANKNFIALLNEYRSLKEKTIFLERQIGTNYLNINTDYFIYITENKVMYIKSMAEWDSNPLLESNAQGARLDDNKGYIVKTKGNNEFTYKDVPFVTGDLMIVHKPSATSDLAVENWTGFVGGYYVPSKQEIKEGQVQATFIKKPSFPSNSTITINVPAFYWKPTGYDSANNKMTFNLYIRDEKGNETDSGITQTIDMFVSTEGSGIERTLTSGNNSIIIEPISSDTGFDIHFKDGEGNVCYFPYSYSRNGTTLTITVEKGSYTGTIYCRINFFKSKPES